VLRWRVVPRLLAGMAAVLLLAACGSAGGSHDPSVLVPGAAPTSTAAAGCAPAKPHAAGDSTAVLTTAAGGRSYVLHVPPSYDGQSRLPLVLLFHGFGGTGRSMLDYSGFGAVADRHHYVVVAPEGQGTPQFWNIAMFTGAADDVAFVRNLVDEVKAELCIDSDRVYAAGFSNGGGMALRLACAMPDTVAAVGVVASMYPQCAATPATPLVAFHGTSDPELPFNGGRLPDEATDFPPVRRVVSEWAVGLGCDGLARISRPAAHVELSTFVRCLLGDGEALLYTIIDGGHTWPGAALDLPAMSGPTNHEVDASELIAAFFDARGGPR